MFIEGLLSVVYETPMKWERFGTVTDWCEGRLITQPEFALLLKGVTYQHPVAPCPLPDPSLWYNWVDSWSANAHRVLKSRWRPPLPVKLSFWLRRGSTGK